MSGFYDTKQIEKLNSRHFKILDLTLEGWSPKQIADHLGISVSGVYIVVRSPSFEHELALRRARITEQQDTRLSLAEQDVTKALKDAAINAANKLITGLDSSDEQLALKSATEILDRSGYPRLQRIESQGRQAVVVLKPEDLSRLQETLRLEAEAMSISNCETLQPSSTREENKKDVN